MNTADLLKAAAARGASDIHLVPDARPLFRIAGLLKPVANSPILSSEKTHEMIFQVLTEAQRARLAEDAGLDFSLMIENTRFRGSLLFQRNGLEAVFRIIPVAIPSAQELMLTPAVTDITNIKGGLVLVTGATGAGKSTTVACLIELINQRRHGNIVTIEDPIEFIFTNKNCVVSQREIGAHVTSFAAALRGVMRHDADVVMIGEMRDLETIGAAITMAETGSLVLATLHSLDAAQAVDRMIDVFPGRQQQQIRTQLAGVLRIVISQTLLPKAHGEGRVALREIMVVNKAIANLIRLGRTHEIYSAIEMGAREGMMTVARALAELTEQGLITPQ